MKRLAIKPQYMVPQYFMQFITDSVTFRFRKGGYRGHYMISADFRYTSGTAVIQAARFLDDKFDFMLSAPFYAYDIYMRELLVSPSLVSRRR